MSVLLHDNARVKLTIKTGFNVVDILNLANLSISSYHRAYNSTTKITKGALLEDIISAAYHGKEISYIIGTRIITFKEMVDISTLVVNLVGEIFNDDMIDCCLGNFSWIFDSHDPLDSPDEKNKPFDPKKLKYYDVITHLYDNYRNKNYTDKTIVLSQFYRNLIIENIDEGSRDYIFVDYCLKYQPMIDLMVRRVLLENTTEEPDININKNIDFEKGILNYLDSIHQESEFDPYEYNIEE